MHTISLITKNEKTPQNESLTNLCVHGLERRRYFNWEALRKIHLKPLHAVVDSYNKKINTITYLYSTYLLTQSFCDRKSSLIHLPDCLTSCLLKIVILIKRLVYFLDLLSNRENSNNNSASFYFFLSWYFNIWFATVSVICECKRLLWHVYMRMERFKHQPNVSAMTRYTDRHQKRLHFKIQHVFILLLTASLLWGNW